jgi:phosphonate transport system substrate-binding protein
MCIFPCTDAANSFRKFHPLVTYLQGATGLNISLVFHDDLAGFERALKNGTLDLAIQDPHVYVKLADKYNNAYILQALTFDKKTTQRGVIIVRKDSGLECIMDLKGKTVMFGSKLSSPRWTAARHLFEKNGFQIDRDLLSYSNGGCCEDVAFNVFLKVVDAGVVCDHFLQEHDSREPELGLDTGQLTVIAETDRVPTKIFSSSKDVRGDDIRQVTRALIGLDLQNPEHRQILQNADLARFTASPLLSRDLPKLRRFVNHSMAQEYVLYVMIVDNDDQIVMHSDLKYAGKTVSQIAEEMCPRHSNLMLMRSGSGAETHRMPNLSAACSLITNAGLLLRKKSVVAKLSSPPLLPGNRLSWINGSQKERISTRSGRMPRERRSSTRRYLTGRPRSSTTRGRRFIRARSMSR